METNEQPAITPNARLFFLLGGVALLLCLPLIAMQFTSEVQWDLADFFVGGVLLTSAALTFEFILRKTKTFRFKIAALALAFLAFFLVWAELAVGVFGTPFAGN